MPIGSDLGETLPVVGDGASTAAARIIDTFQKLIAAVEGRVNTSVLTSNADLDMLGYFLKHVGAVELQNQSAVPSVPRYLQVFGDDLYYVNPAGAVKITDGVTLNASGIGGIGGDYGLSDEIVEYDATNDRYEFYDHVSDFSAIMGSHVIIRGTGGGDCTLDSSATSAVGWTFPDTPAAEGIVTANTSANISVSPTVGFKVTFSVLPNTPDDEVMQSLHNAFATSGVIAQNQNGISATSGSTFTLDIQGIPVGNRIKALKISMLRLAAGTASIKLRKRVITGGVAGLSDVGTAATTTTTDAANAVTLDKTGLTETVTARTSYVAEIILPNAGDALIGFSVIHDRVA